MQRVLNVPEEEWYLNPWDGRLAKLVVQAVDDVLDAPGESTWRRTFIRNASSPIIRTANWPINSVPVDKATWSSEDGLHVSAKWLPACILLMILVRPGSA